MVDTARWPNDTCVLDSHFQMIKVSTDELLLFSDVVKWYVLMEQTLN